MEINKGLMKDVLIQLVELIMNEPFPPSERGSTKGGEYILELFATAGLNSHENIELFCGTIELTVTFFSSCLFPTLLVILLPLSLHFPPFFFLSLSSCRSNGQQQQFFYLSDGAIIKFYFFVVQRS